MTGYQETVTDPGYAAQLVCFTAPMVGNYGVDDRRLSRRRRTPAVLMRRLGGEDWALWLAERGIVGLDEIDTRGLTLRCASRSDARVTVADEQGLAVPDALDQVRAQPRWRIRARRQVSTRRRASSRRKGRSASRSWTTASKRSILRRLDSAGAAVMYPFAPGRPRRPRRRPSLEWPERPAPLVEETRVVRETLGRVPVLGICLGHQPR